MKYRTTQAQEVYENIIFETSKQVADLFAEIDKLELEDVDRFLLQVHVHTFHQEGMCRAVQTAMSVEV